MKDWPENADPAAVGLRVAQLFVKETPLDPRHYKVACAWYGALKFAATQEKKLPPTNGITATGAVVQALTERYDSYKSTWNDLLGGRKYMSNDPAIVDDYVFGIVPLEIALLGLSDPVPRQEGLALADYELENLATLRRFAIDDMFMITALLVQAHRVTQQKKYRDAAATTMAEYLRLQQNDGLFFHHIDFRHKWGRGNGWFAAGMAELLSELPPDDPRYSPIMESYTKMMTGLLEYQLKEGAGVGLWKQIVNSNDTRNWPETSGSAMFVYALVSGVRAGWLPRDPYCAAARAGWLALVGKLDADGKLQDISDWAYKPSSEPETAAKYKDDEEGYYFNRDKKLGDNHGQAPVLWAATALTR